MSLTLVKFYILPQSVVCFAKETWLDKMVKEIDSYVGVSYKPVRFENIEELYDATGN